MRLWRDKRGALWLWAVALLTIIVLSFMSFAVGWPTHMIIELIETKYAYTGTAAYAVEFMKLLLEWFPILMCLGLLLWLFVNSLRRGEAEPI